MKRDDDPGDSHTSDFTPDKIKIDSSIQHLRSDLMQHGFVKTYLRQITDVCDPPVS
jgi:hypothetical protein